MQITIEFNYQLDSQSEINNFIHCEIELWTGKTACFSTYVKSYKENAIISAISSCLDELGYYGNDVVFDIESLDEFRFKYKFDIDKISHREGSNTIVYILSGDERVFGKNKYCKCCNCGGE